MPEIAINPDIDAERATLGAILLNEEVLADVADWLKAEHFYRNGHRTIYEAMLHLYNHEQEILPFTVYDLLHRWGRLSDLPGDTEADAELYIGMLVKCPESSYLIEKYAKRVKATALRTRLIHAGVSITALGLEDDVEQAIAKAEELLYQIGRDETPTDVVPISEVEQDFYAWYDQVPEGGAIVGVPTGLHTIDNLTGGLQKSDLIVLAARPGMGKTSLAMTITRQTALTYKRGVLIFSLEMSKRQLFQRLVSQEARINLKRLRMKQISFDEGDRAVECAERIGAAPIYIDDTPALSTAAMRSRIRRTMARHDIDLVIVDYLQKMTALDGNGKRYSTEYQEVSEIIKQLKDMARTFDVPILALSQLSRASEGRTDKVPQLSDLRSSGAIEQESDIVILLHRDEYYNGKESQRKGRADIIFAKHRNGEMSELGEYELAFEAEYTNFANLAEVRRPLSLVPRGEEEEHDDDDDTAEN